MATGCKTTTPACGQIFEGRDGVATWPGKHGPPEVDRCSACQSGIEGLKERRAAFIEGAEEQPGAYGQVEPLMQDARASEVGPAR